MNHHFDDYAKGRFGGVSESSIVKSGSQFSDISNAISFKSTVSTVDLLFNKLRANAKLI